MINFEEKNVTESPTGTRGETQIGGSASFLFRICTEEELKGGTSRRASTGTHGETHNGGSASFYFGYTEEHKNKCHAGYQQKQTAVFGFAPD